MEDEFVGFHIKFVSILPPILADSNAPNRERHRRSSLHLTAIRIQEAALLRPRKISQFRFEDAVF
jgi:hypothetical protein